MTNRDMTPQALARRADEIATDYTVGDILGNGDEREVACYFEHLDCDLEDPNPDAWSRPGVYREIIGVVIGGDVVLTRTEAREMLGDNFIKASEGEAWEYEA